MLVEFVVQHVWPALYPIIVLSAVLRYLPASWPIITLFEALVVSLLAKQEFGVPRVVARVNNPNNYWMFNDMWGVDVSVSTPHLITSLVQEAVTIGSFVRLMQLKGGKAELVEVTLADNSPALDKALADIQFPRSATVVAIVRDSRVLVPDKATVLRVGDEVMALITEDAEDAVKKILVG